MAESTVPGAKPAVVAESGFEALFRSVGVDGFLGSPADTAVVYADGSGMFVRIRAGKEAWNRASLWQSGGSEFTKAIAANSSGQTRIDRVVVRLSRTTWACTAEIVQGTPGAGAPAISQDNPPGGSWDLLAADVTVANGAAVIGAAAVTRREVYVGEQTIVTTSERRPAHKPGRTILETDTGRLLVSIAGGWRAVALSDSDSQVSFTLSASTPAGAPSVGRVWIRMPS